MVLERIRELEAETVGLKQELIDANTKLEASETLFNATRRAQLEGEANQETHNALERAREVQLEAEVEALEASLEAAEKFRGQTAEDRERIENEVRKARAEREELFLAQAWALPHHLPA